MPDQGRMTMMSAPPSDDQEVGEYQDLVGYRRDPPRGVPVAETIFHIVMAIGLAAFVLRAVWVLAF